MTFFIINPEDNIIFLLMSKIGSLGVYHILIDAIDKFLFHKKSSSEEENNFKLALIKPTIIVVKRFGDHIYRNKCHKCEPIVNIIFKSTEIIQKNFVSHSSHIPEENEEMKVSYFNKSTALNTEVCYPSNKNKRVNKCGLSNLGNTCYMNSVLQALAMTKQFCREVLLYKATNDLSDQTVLKNLQNLFALLQYSKRTSLAPTEILRSSRPSYFMPGQQQDSSEFLCHLLDILYEQEKSALLQISDNGYVGKSKAKDEEMDTKEEAEESDSHLHDDGTKGSMTRWITEEDLSKGASLQRKTQSLADFTQGEELSESQNGLPHSHSDSTDSGIQSVGGEDSTPSSASSTSSPADNFSSSVSSSCLVHRVFGGELRISYQCHKCHTESNNTDQFRDLQLCFLETLDSNDPITVQDLINSNYFMPEELTGDNQYRCDNCACLRDAQRIIKILRAPAHLILTLKYFRYDSESRPRTKLRRRVMYDDTINLSVLDKDNETYKLYAAVVHSGNSMDYGHYVTYACDLSNRWYKFNDCLVTRTTLEDVKSLEFPETPYILFYKKCQDAPEEDVPEFSMLDKSVQEYIEQEKRKFEEEHKNTRFGMSSGFSKYNSNNSWDRDQNDDNDGNPPPSNCRSAMSIPNQQCLY